MIRHSFLKSCIKYCRVFKVYFTILRHYGLKDKTTFFSFLFLERLTLRQEFQFSLSMKRFKQKAVLLTKSEPIRLEQLRNKTSSVVRFLKNRVLPKQKMNKCTWQLIYPCSYLLSLLVDHAPYIYRNFLLLHYSYICNDPWCYYMAQ